MFKLVAVGGKLRGKEFVLQDGENVLGRGADCDHVLSVEGVSKKHLTVTVNGDSAFAEDLGSSNGTIVNGKIIKRMTLQDGDKIALPNLILQVVYVLEKKTIIKKKVARVGEDDDSAYDDLNQIEPMPTSLLAKPIWFFKYKVMPVIYSFNEQYEWSALVGILLFIFIAINITLTILPVLSDSKKLLIKEIALRGKQYAAEVDRLNNVYLRDKSLDQVKTSFLEGEDAEGVQSYKLFDTEGRVYRPVSELNTIVNDPFSVEALKFFKVEANQDKPVAEALSNNTIGIARAIKAHDKNLGRDVVVAIITIYFSPTSLAREASNNSKAYLESLVTSAMVAIIFFGMLYYMTTRPLEDLKNQIERVLRGRQKELESKVLFRELAPLRNTVNSILNRIKELQNQDTGEMSLEEDGPYLRTLKEFLAGAGVPAMIMNSEHIIQDINEEAGEMTRMKANTSVGMSILETAPNQGFSGTILDLCQKSANNEGSHQSEPFDLFGVVMTINVCALIGKDKFVKGFYVTFVRNT